MAGAQKKQERTLKEMLSKSPATRDKLSPTASSSQPSQERDAKDLPITRGFLEALFNSLRDDFQTLKQDISSEVREIRRDVDELWDRVALVEASDQSRSEELEFLQQEVLRLKDKQVDLKHTRKTWKTGPDAITSASEGSRAEKKERTWPATSRAFSGTSSANPPPSTSASTGPTSGSREESSSSAPGHLGLPS